MPFMESQLMKKEFNGLWGSWVKHRFVLRQDGFGYIPSSNKGHPDQAKLQAHVPLNAIVSVRPCTDGMWCDDMGSRLKTGKQHCFTVSMTTRGRVRNYLFACDSDAGLQQWVQAFTTAIATVRGPPQPHTAPAPQPYGAPAPMYTAQGPPQGYAQGYAKGVPPPQQPASPPPPQYPPQPAYAQPQPQQGYPAQSPPPPPPQQQQQGYPAPQQGYPAPQQGYPAPQQGYPAPQQGYPAPQQGYPAPQQGYPAPQQGYPAPQQGYPAPQQGYPAPPPPAYN